MNYLRLKDVREENNLLQKDIAQLIGVNQSQYCLYENGIRLIPVDKLILLAKYYNVSTDYLLGLTNIKYPYPS